MGAIASDAQVGARHHCRDGQQVCKDRMGRAGTGRAVPGAGNGGVTEREPRVVRSVRSRL